MIGSFAKEVVDGQKKIEKEINHNPCEGCKKHCKCSKKKGDKENDKE